MYICGEPAQTHVLLPVTLAEGGLLCIVELTNVESLQIPNTTYIVGVIRS